MRLKKTVRRSLNILLIGSLAYVSLKTYNDNLEIQIIAKSLKIEDYQIELRPKVEPIEYIEPCSTSSAKTYMDYRMITSTSSDQYRYIQEHMEISDGFLYDKEGNIGVALGSWFGEIGSKWHFYLDTGIVLKTVKIEAKDDAHTFDGCQQRWDTSVIEFVIDSETIRHEVADNVYIASGNFNNIEEFNGNILKLRRVE